tara:strand:- start:19220 stop:19573 length:354 start_codon:yes stop_codon:yes gene_type:complete
VSQDKREHLRLVLGCRVFIDLSSGPSGGEPDKDIARCTTFDVSYGGLKVSLPRELKVGAFLQVGVEFPTVEKPLYLVGEVKWCRPATAPDEGWSAGLQIVDSHDSDIDAWQEMLLHI